MSLASQVEGVGIRGGGNEETNGIRTGIILRNCEVQVPGQGDKMGLLNGGLWQMEKFVLR